MCPFQEEMISAYAPLCVAIWAIFQPSTRICQACRPYTSSYGSGVLSTRPAPFRRNPQSVPVATRAPRVHRRTRDKYNVLVYAFTTSTYD